MKIIAKKCDNTHDVFLYWWENNWAWKTIFCLVFRFRESLLSYCRWKTTFVDYYFSVLMYKFSTATFEPFSPLHGTLRPLTATNFPRPSNFFCGHIWAKWPSPRPPGNPGAGPGRKCARSLQTCPYSSSAFIAGGKFKCSEYNLKKAKLSRG